MENGLEPLRVLSVKETAEVLRISPQTVKSMIRRKELPAFKVGGQWRVHGNKLAKWFKEPQ